MASTSNDSLRLISAYGSSGDESEEEVPSCRVSVKRSFDSNDCFSSSNKRHAIDSNNKCERLPPPAAIANLFTDNFSRDDPDNHGGRVRSFAHERGNWASYVFVSVDPSESLMSFIDVVCNTCDSSINLQRSDNLHISLTRTVILKHHWIEPFSSSVKKISNILFRFPVCLGELKVYCNEELTRTFVGIVITAGQENLLKISQRLDEALADFKLPPFYEEASFHLSIAWCTGDFRDAISSQLPRLQSVLEMFIHSQPLQWNIPVDKIHLRTGNKYFEYNLTNFSS